MPTKQKGGTGNWHGTNNNGDKKREKKVNKKREKKVKDKAEKRNKRIEGKYDTKEEMIMCKAAKVAAEKRSISRQDKKEKDLCEKTKRKIRGEVRDTKKENGRNSGCADTIHQC